MGLDSDVMFFFWKAHEASGGQRVTTKLRVAWMIPQQNQVIREESFDSIRGSSEG